MKAFLSISLISTLISFQSFGRLPSTDCNALRETAENACSERQVKWSCENLKTCHGFRDKCPQSRETFTGCESLSSCLETDAQVRKSRRFCKYGWSGQPNDGVCYLKNNTNNAFTYSCPGFGISIDTNADSLFTCEGHRQRTIGKMVNCKNALDDFKSSCPTQGISITQRNTECAEAQITLSQPESAISPRVSQSGPREQGSAPMKEESIHASSQATSATSATR